MDRAQGRCLESLEDAAAPDAQTCVVFNSSPGSSSLKKESYPSEEVLGAALERLEKLLETSAVNLRAAAS